MARDRSVCGVGTRQLPHFGASTTALSGLYHLQSVLPARQHPVIVIRGLPLS